MNARYALRSSAISFALLLVLLAAAGCSVKDMGGKAPDSYVEARFLLPIKDNQGAPFEESRFQWLEQDMARKFGGYTYEGLYKGAYYDGKVTQFETSRRYVIAVRKSRMNELKNYLMKIKKEFGQKSLYLSISQGEVMFL
ncbi:MAG: hypothetical protein NTX50_27560 [Candidatus Sumerlaeota bacterium]|nr:hypothetical protein [Candidatus Sumerlaeota bacterium]